MSQGQRRRAAPEGPYALTPRLNLPVVYVVAPPHALPYTAKFAEPGEPDSV